MEDQERRSKESYTHILEVWRRRGRL